MKTMILVVASLAACSGGSQKPTAPVAHQDPIPMTEQPADAMPAPTPPSEPAKPDPAKVKADLLAAEIAAYEKAKLVFETNCARCHTKTGRLTKDKTRDHFDMTSYPFGGHHAMEIGKEIREALGITGDKVTMPKDKKGAVKGDDLKLIAAWADAFDAAHAGGAHEGHGEHDHDHH